MGFADLIGHANLLDSFRAALANGRLHHAYLFTGPEGVGKCTFAMSLAKALHCSAIVGDYCGHCADCSSIVDGNHPDVRVVRPLAGKKEISIYQVREMERELRYRSFSGKHKIAVVDPAVAMNASAQNALLKTLEEPPENSLIVLVTANVGGLLPTLRSRCLRLSFGPLSRRQVAAFLRAQRNISDADAEVLAAMSMGSIGVAVNLDQTEFMEKRRIWIDILTALRRRDYQAAMAGAETLAGSREESLEFLNWAASWYRDLLIHEVNNKADELVNLDVLPQIRQLTAQSVGNRALAALKLIEDARAGIQRNLNRRMVLEKFLFGVVETP